MEAFDDLYLTCTEKVERDVIWTEGIGLTTSPRRADWRQFEDNVLAEARGKAKILSTIKTAVQERQGCPEPGDSDEDTVQDEMTGKEHGNITSNLEPDSEDYRKHLFEAIPEPYPHPTNFQRVIITDDEDEADPDTQTACTTLKRCIDLRTKYMDRHCISKQKINKKTLFQPQPGQFRRRPEPKYDVFDRALPPPASAYLPIWENGVFRVFSSAQEQEGQECTFDTIGFQEFIADYNYVRLLCHASSCLILNEHHPCPSPPLLAITCPDSVCKHRCVKVSTPGRSSPTPSSASSCCRPNTTCTVC